MLKAIFMDFDGVILDTVQIKLQGFLHLFRHYSKDVLEKIKRLHLENGGLSRFEKFRIIYNQYLNKPLEDAERERLGNEFNEFCYHQVLKAPYVEGVQDFLEWAYQKYSLFVISGTPDEEMKRIVQDLNIAKYFKEVLGSPETKDKLCGRLMKQYQWKANEIIFIGDAPSDLLGAQANGIPFVAIISPDNESLFKDVNVRKIRNFLGFEKILNTLNE